jgi:hypothetical protein
MADIEVHILVAAVGLALTNCQGIMSDSIFFDESAKMSMIEDHQKCREEWIGGNEKEAIIEEGFEVEGKGFKGWRIFFD